MEGERLRERDRAYKRAKRLDPGVRELVLARERERYAADRERLRAKNRKQKQAKRRALVESVTEQAIRAGLIEEAKEVFGGG